MFHPLFPPCSVKRLATGTVKQSSDQSCRTRWANLHHRLYIHIRSDFKHNSYFATPLIQKYCTIFMPHFQSFPVEICQIFYELFGFLIQWQYGTNNLKIKTLNQFFNNIKALKKKKRQNLKNKTLVQQIIFTLQKFHKQRKS